MTIEIICKYVLNIFEQDHTLGINCERCEDGYYRPEGVALDDPRPCIKCNCSTFGSEGHCVPDGTQGFLLGKVGIGSLYV